MAEVRPKGWLTARPKGLEYGEDDMPKARVLWCNPRHSVIGTNFSPAATLSTTSSSAPAATASTTTTATGTTTARARVATA